MCGIFGYSGKEPADISDVRLNKVMESLRHRGPDAKGLWQSDAQTQVLGHTRLCILDLDERSNQPFVSASGNAVMSFNGEIYNWRAVKQRLIKAGYAFRTESDSEVLLALYEEAGTEMLNEIEGMYAFAIYDKRSDYLFCARDPIGKKPFMYFCEDQGFYFASEINALRLLADKSFEKNCEALSNMLLHNLRHIPEPFTAWKKIKKLRPGFAIVVQGGKILNEFRYWQPKLVNIEANSRIQTVKQVLQDAVKKRMYADVPLAVLLSGGIDSSAICGMMKQAGVTQIKTYCLGLNDQDQDIQRARVASAYYGTEHKEFFFDAQHVWDDYNGLIKNYGEPLALLPLVYTKHLAKLMRSDGVFVGLGGHGADELFLGYDGQWRKSLLAKLLQGIPRGLLNLGSQIVPANMRWLLKEAGYRKSSQYKERAASLWPAIIKEEYNNSFNCYVADEMAKSTNLFELKTFLEESSLLALLIENQHSLTTAADFPAMLEGVELRCPFLDPLLISIVLSIPLTDRSAFDYVGPKAFLKAIVNEYVPEQLLTASKRGFGYGIQEKDLFRGPWQDKINDLFKSIYIPFLQQDSLRKLWTGFQQGDDSNVTLLSKLVAMHIWWQEQSC